MSLIYTKLPAADLKSFLGCVFKGFFYILLCFSELLGVHFWSHFGVFFYFLGYAFKHRFLLSSRAHFSMIFGVISTSFFVMFSQLFAPLVLMVFDNPSNRKLVFHRSHGITFNTFCACFFDFISSVIFDMIFSTFEAISVSILRKKTKKQLVEKLGFLAAKKEPPKQFFIFSNAFSDHF